ncbi:hypothetical protein [Catalinimonas alkaloidigena]|uniref:hypothetical protein n=1 Tax=Catalinimonas alkaloidigena TaxID=1075417 RepID=UPI002405C9C6|nr:hypothetical protein [Catalinimonas alkaloidigena]
MNLVYINFATGQIVVQKGVLSQSVTSFVTTNKSVINHGKLIHQGTLVAEEDILNYSEYEASEGTLVLKGEDQIISSTSTTLGGVEVIYGGKKNIKGTFYIQDHLSLNRGMLRVPEKSKLILQENATIHQSSAISYIQGYLYHQGEGEKFFPVGSVDQYAPLTLHNVSGENTTLGVTYLPQKNIPYWRQNVLSGTYLGSTLSLNFQSNKQDYLYYQDALEVMALQEVDGKLNTLGVQYLTNEESRFTITSSKKTTLPWLSVGFSEVSALERVFVPNAYSTSATNIEDQGIKVYGKYISFENFHFGIQDQWGRWVYQTASLLDAMDNGWKQSNLSHSITKYRYIISGKFLSGTTFQRSDIIVNF